MKKRKSKLSATEVEAIILKTLRKAYQGYDYRRVADGMYIKVGNSHICTTYTENKTRNDYTIPAIEKANLLTIINSNKE